MKKNVEIGFVFSFDDKEEIITSVEDFDKQTTEFYKQTRDYLKNLFGDKISPMLDDAPFYQVVKRVMPIPPPVKLKKILRSLKPLQ